MKEFHEVQILPNKNVDPGVMIQVNHDHYGATFHLETSDENVCGKRTAIFPSENQVIIPISTQTITKNMKFDLMFVL